MQAISVDAVFDKVTSVLAQRDTGLVVEPALIATA
jgi:hypothetical protein